MCNAVRTHPGHGESPHLQYRDDSGDSALFGTYVGDHVAVLADVRRELATFQGVEQHHLAPDERSRQRWVHPEIEEYVPELVDR